MTRTLASSVGVLDASTTITSQIDAVLMGQEGLDTDPDISWVPGDPLFEDPRLRDLFCDEYFVDGGEYEDATIFMTQQCVRPMIDVFETDDTMDSPYGERSRYFCMPCQAAGSVGEDECWLCGKEYPLKFQSRGTITHTHSISNYSESTLAFAAFGDAAHRALEDLRLYESAFFLEAYCQYDAYLSQSTFYGISRRIQPYTPPEIPEPETRGYIVPQEAVEAVQELPEIVRGRDITCPIPRRSGRIFGDPGHFREILATSLRIPAEIPTAQPLMPEYRPLPSFEGDIIPDRAYGPTNQQITQERRSRHI